MEESIPVLLPTNTFMTHFLKGALIYELGELNSLVGLNAYHVYLSYCHLQKPLCYKLNCRLKHILPRYDLISIYFEKHFEFDADILSANETRSGRLSTELYATFSRSKRRCAKNSLEEKQLPLFS